MTENECFNIIINKIEIQNQIYIIKKIQIYKKHFDLIRSCHCYAMLFHDLSNRIISKHYQSDESDSDISVIKDDEIEKIESDIIIVMEAEQIISKNFYEK